MVNMKGRNRRWHGLKHKELVNTRLATNYGGWMYCTNCNKNIGYLCYVTYDCLKLQYECNCGSKGEAFLDFVDSKTGTNGDQELITIKNRYCCPSDTSPLITISDKNVKQYNLEITCKACGTIFHKDETRE